MNKRKSLFLVLTCFASLIFSANISYSQTLCDPPVLLVENDTLYNTIMEAYDDASINLGLSDITIKLAGDSITEELSLYADVTVYLDGGYDCTFSSKDLLNTNIIGSITISGGTLVPGSLGVTSPPACAFDSDGDGYTSIGSCSGSADDCDDSNANTYPGAPEICDGLDNNCDGQADEGLTAVDADGDGYSAIGSCGGTADDCNDNDPSINPGAQEFLGDGIDQNCDGADLTFSVDGDCFGCHDVGFVNNIYHQSVAAPDGSCISCHAMTVNSFLDGHYGKTVKTAGNNMAAGATIGCVSCHDWHDEGYSGYAIDGANIVWPKVTAVWPNVTCDTCHEDRAALHAAAHTVEVGPDDLSYDSPGIPCSNCHVVANWSEIEGIEHNVPTNGDGSCATCHNSPRQEVQINITSGIPPIHCLDCHSDKDLTPHGSVDHVASGYVTIEAGCAVCHPDPATTFTSGSNNKVHNGCATCHDAATNALIGSAAGHEGGPNVCTTCHIGRVWTDHTIDHQAAGYVTLHSECTSCHATTMTAGQGFINPADDEKHNACTSCHAADGSQSTGSGDCSMCHSGVTSDWTTHVQDHTAKVTLATGCASCHSATVEYANFVDPGNNLKHDDCYACHNATTKLPIATAGDCSQCHSGVTGDFSTHTTQDHTSKVTSATGCVSCHSATVDYVNFVDPANNLKHDGCTSCHDSTTNAPIATAGDCSQCHSGVTGDFTTHATQDHTTKVTLQAECSNCHTETVDYANFIDAANDKKHDSCVTCHDATTNAPIATAGDCSQCHTDTWETTHTPAPDHTGIVTTSGTTGLGGCGTCHNDPPPLVDSGDPKVHNSCNSCHETNGTLKSLAIGKSAPGNCETCHINKEPHGSVDHSLENVTVGGSQDYYGTTCASCHDYPSGSQDVITDIHKIPSSNNCQICHQNDPPTSALNAGLSKGDCVNCHTGSVHTLWGRYLDTCSSSGCHTGFNGGPGNALHDAHNPVGGWSDRNSATNSLNYPYATDPNMWTANWPLNPDCATCHTAFDDASSGRGCGACHAFPGKGDLHLRHSDKPMRGGLGIQCSTCHYQS